MPAAMTSKVGPKRLASILHLASSLSPGERVYLPGSTAEPDGLMDALLQPDAPPVAITATYVPGVNAIPLARASPKTTWTSMFAPATIPGAQASAVFQHLPMSYSAFARHLDQHLTFDTCIVHVAPPDADGNCSLGPAVEFTPIAVRKSRRVLAVINRRMPRIPHSATLPYASFHATVDIDAPLRAYDTGAPTPQADAIAARLAAYVTDDVTLQIGLGKVPDALMARVVDRRGLKLFSGMLSDGARALADRGALDAGFTHTCCLHLGSAPYYDWLADRPDIRVRGCDYTHAAAALATLKRFVAVNSALSVDLFGQANLEMLDGRMVSGCGGAPDYARGAALSPGGVSIIALPSTGGREAATRIVPRLDGICSLPRNDIDVVVTEHGAADLRGVSVMQRAERLIAIAAPEHRAGLVDAWRAISKKI